MNFNEMFPSDLLSTSEQEDNSGKGTRGNFQICGKDVPRGYWVDTWALFYYFNFAIMLFSAYI